VLLCECMIAFDNSIIMIGMMEWGVQYHKLKGRYDNNEWTIDDDDVIILMC
jgi:hypothetical protein